ncbi:MAG: SusC/RagA family TonB-linked outer membrane protein [Prevotellaceae bacterium]|jgi:TonB-linked SusC/RagA family outer membrane protein|nr:SusC/RagA family TonB-linked outer membrane protein [Prevotellaceae bacterium]
MKKILKLIKSNLHKLAMIAVICSCSGMAFAQSNITGKITDEAGDPLAGASVVVKGTTNGVVADVRGNYSITVSDNNSVLEFSFLGYVSQDINVGGRSVINVSLAESAMELEEVVVTALGITKEAKKTGYAVSTIKSDDLVKAGAANLGTAIYGKASGVRISSPPGGAASGVSFTIRGLSSINGNTQPLVILNGVPVRNGNDEGDNGMYASFGSEGRIRSNGLVDINPEDIESFSILKGAAATALYGSDAANGVLVITSKASKSQGFKVSLNATLQANMVAYLPRIQTEYGPGLYSTYSPLTESELLTGFRRLNYNDERYEVPYYATNVSFGPRYDGRDVLYWDGKVRPYVSQTGSNIWEDLFRTGFDQIYNVAIDHGGANSNTRFSFTYLNELPNGLTGSFDKYNFNLVGNVKLGKKLSLDYSGNYIVQKVHNRSGRSTGAYDSFSNLFGSFVDVDLMKQMYKTSLGYRNNNRGDATLTPDETFAFSPGAGGWVKDHLWGVYMNNDYETDSRFIASVSPMWKITDWLTLKGRLSSDLSADKIEYKNASDQSLVLSSPTGSYRAVEKQYNVVYGDAMLMFDKKLNEKISLNANLVWQARQENMMLMQAWTNGGLTVENMFLLNASRDQIGTDQSRMEYLKTAVLGTLGLSYGDYLFLELTARQEKSSTLPKGSNSYFYPSANLSFVFTDAFKDQLPKWYSYGKLRASYGIVGNAPGAYAANIVYSIRSGGGVSWSELPGTLGNPKLKPEKINEFEIGWENKLFKNRLGFEVSYYNRVITEMLAQQPLVASDGAANIWANIGEMVNKGVEISLTGTPIETRDWQWDIRTHFAFNRNKINKLIDGVDYLRGGGAFGNTGGGVNVRSYVGRPMGDLYVNRVQHVSSDPNSQYYDPTGQYVGQPITIVPGYGASEGEGYYLTSTGQDNQEYIGNINPKLVGGLGTTLTWKRLTLDVMTDYRIGGMVFNSANQYPTCRGLTEETLQYRDKEHGGLEYTYNYNGKNYTRDNGWIVPGVIMTGDNTFTPNDKITAIDSYYWATYGWGPNNVGGTYEFSIHENSYWKMRELALAYSIPENIIGKASLRNLTVSVFGRNLFYIYKTLKNIDPESTNGGTTWGGQAGVGYSNSPTRTIGLSLRATF